MVQVLSLLEARVLGVLVEKERTVPDSYPLTLNALVAGCNQKTSRDPVLNAAETDVQTAVNGLKSMLLVIERRGERVARYAHNIERMMNVPQQAAVLLAVMMLRGPQTAGELRINCERLHRFADIPAVEALLNELAERPDGALVTELPRLSAATSHLPPTPIEDPPLDPLRSPGQLEDLVLEHDLVRVPAREAHVELAVPNPAHIEHDVRVDLEHGEILGVFSDDIGREIPFLGVLARWCVFFAPHWCTRGRVSAPLAQPVHSRVNAPTAQPRGSCP
jgi:hypothetical protein